MNEITWKALRESLPEGMSEEALELVRRATAGDRQRARVQATIEAALAYITADAPTREACLDAAHIVELDCYGTGGPLDAGGDATARMTWARSLGKGRRQASDGGAWMAAAKDAQALLLRIARGEHYDWLHVRGEPIQDAEPLSAAALIRAVQQIIIKEDLCFARTFARSKIAELGRRFNGLMPEREAEWAREAMRKIAAELTEWSRALDSVDEEARVGAPSPEAAQ